MNKHDLKDRIRYLMSVIGYDNYNFQKINHKKNNAIKELMDYKAALLEALDNKNVIKVPKER